MASSCNSHTWYFASISEGVTDWLAFHSYLLYIENLDDFKNVALSMSAEFPKLFSYKLDWKFSKSSDFSLQITTIFIVFLIVAASFVLLLCVLFINAYDAIIKILTRFYSFFINHSLNASAVMIKSLIITWMALLIVLHDSY